MSAATPDWPRVGAWIRRRISPSSVRWFDRLVCDRSVRVEELRDFLKASLRADDFNEFETVLGEWSARRGKVGKVDDESWRKWIL